MRTKIYTWVIMGLTVLVPALPARAQGEQWLQYRSARQAERIVGDMRSNYLELTGDKPEGVELPELKCEEPFFVRWSSPMVKNGHLWIALDRSQKYGPYDRLFIDSDGDGSLKDETAVEPYQTEQNQSYFGPVRVVFEVADGPVTYHLNFRFYARDSRRYFWATSGGWYEGAITVDGEKKHCVLIDYNANGTFDDKGLNFGECDRVRIGKKDERESRFVGNYVQVDGVLYRPEIARDGAYIKLARAEDVTFGTVRMQETITEFAAGGDNGLLFAELDKGVGQLPVGKYRVHHWRIDRKDDKENAWKLEGSYFGERGDFEVVKDSEVALQMGEPVLSTMDVRKEGSEYGFRQNFEGQLGERISIERSGGRAQAPRLHVRNKDGSYDRTFAFEYG